MFLQTENRVSGWLDYHEFVDGFNKIYAVDPKTAKLGIEQLKAWNIKNDKSVFVESTYRLRELLLCNDRSPKTLDNLFYIIQKIGKRIISKVPKDDQYFKTLAKYVSDLDFEINRDEIIDLAIFVFNFLKDCFWKKTIETRQKKIDEYTESLTQYFVDSQTQEYIVNGKSSFILFFSPHFVDLLCNEEEEIFGFEKSKFIEKLPKFLEEVDSQLNNKYKTGFILELAEHLIQGSEWAIEILNYFIEEKICNIETLSEFVFCFPTISEQAESFFEQHEIPIKLSNNNIWPSSPIGTCPYLAPPGDIDSSLVGFAESDKPKNKSQKPKNDTKKQIKTDPKATVKIQTRNFITKGPKIEKPGPKIEKPTISVEKPSSKKMIITFAPKKINDSDK
ncbi:hypothetical protein TRFO_06196 [Tritrichomonas foetus]|uniref:Uncharacterized protein n=1 Tax=Tritrichomonas foetus TaxID=1144522 RepID=A0A1J4K4W3_9EUKA|nr:hypothetical protein TRFO_06196 [Tritrichomonas foetus]|eukprot:OHT04756.1 hypothetical protein TRFO_06196 [Tritrichomonas foetus]